MRAVDGNLSWYKTKEGAVAITKDTLTLFLQINLHQIGF